jgi:Fe-Mn family superoxide dismutase
MTFALPRLPYAFDALEPYLSRRAMEFHYTKHHAGYLAKLTELAHGTPLHSLGLAEIVIRTAEDPAQAALFNNAAQAWNHALYWQSMRPEGGGAPQGALGSRVRETFGGLDGFRKRFLEAAVAQFGSGWAWLVLDNGRLEVVTTANADTPIADGATPLLVCDLWEHAYYLDYQHRRAEFVRAFLDQLVDWHAAEARFESTHV